VIHWSRIRGYWLPLLIVVGVRCGLLASSAEFAPNADPGDVKLRVADSCYIRFHDLIP